MKYHKSEDTSITAFKQNLTGFIFDYVIQGPSGSSSDPITPGPHIMELMFLGSNVSWPYLSNLEIIHNVSQIFTHYFLNQQQQQSHFNEESHDDHSDSNAYDNWMYINVIIKNSDLFIPMFQNTLYNKYTIENGYFTSK